MLNVEATQARAVPRRSGAGSNLSRVLRYTLVRGLTLLVTVVIAVYLTILIANGGGYVDQMRIGQIREQVILQMGSDPEMALLTVQQRKQLEEER